METTRTVTCGSCGIRIDEPTDIRPEAPEPCPGCGSKTRNAAISLFDTVEVHEQARVKAQHASGGKASRELIAGDDLHRATGKWNHLRREIDRRGNRYVERITDPESGQIIRDVDEPLSDHIGHGSAKGKPRRK